MSSAHIICRACLARNSRMYRITNPELQATFEKLSGATLITKDDGKPNTICYICFALLRKCWKFRKMSREANKHIIKFLRNSMPQPAQEITLDNEIKYTLSIAKTKHTSMSHHEYIKDENMSHEDVKHEDSETIAKERTKVNENELISNEDPAERGLTADIPDYYEKTGSMSPKQERNSTEHMSVIPHNESINTESTAIDIEPILAQPNTNVPKNKGKRYSCDTCHKKFKQFTNLQTHIARHKPLKPFSCVKCFETFINQKELHKHEHCKVTRHVCDICSKAYVSKYSLQVHKANNHLKSAGKMYKCDTCSKAFNHRGTLRLHMRIHTGDKPYACDKCPKSFSQKGTLLRHNRMHTGEKPYACHKCTKTFNQESSLKRHIKMHNGEKTYACSRCDKTYYESSHLTRHMRTHTGEKPYACDRCFQTFSQSSNLHTHMKKHTGKRASNFTCFECSKTFDHKSIYNRHLLKHTQEKPYPCDQCDKKYADKRTLQRHVLCHSQNV